MSRPRRKDAGPDRLALRGIVGLARLGGCKGAHPALELGIRQLAADAGVPAVGPVDVRRLRGGDLQLARPPDVAAAAYCQAPTARSALPSPSRSPA